MTKHQKAQDETVNKIPYTTERLGIIPLYQKKKIKGKHQNPEKTNKRGLSKTNL